VSTPDPVLKRVGDVVVDVGRHPKIKRTDYLAEGALSVIDQGETFVAGYTDDLSARADVPLPIVVFGDHTRILKLVSFPFAQGADGTVLLRPNENWDIRYFYYCLLYVDLKNYGYERHLKYLREERVPWRPLPVQRRIADILSAYDHLIENNEKRIKTVEGMSRYLHREWFVNFRFPGHEEVKMLRSSAGKLPQGWRTAPIAELVRRLPNRSTLTEKEVQGDGPTLVLDQSQKDILGFHDGPAAFNASPAAPLILFGDHGICQRE
jgi:type I restriction enzyme S subunit